MSELLPSLCALKVKHVLVTSLADVLTFQVLDYNTRTKDTELGTATFELSKLEVDASLEGLTTNILDEGRVRGELRFDAYVVAVLPFSSSLYRRHDH